MVELASLSSARGATRDARNTRHSQALRSHGARDSGRDLQSAVRGAGDAMRSNSPASVARDSGRDKIRGARVGGCDAINFAGLCGHWTIAAMVRLLEVPNKLLTRGAQGRRRRRRRRTPLGLERCCAREKAGPATRSQHTTILHGRWRSIYPGNYDAE